MEIEWNNGDECVYKGGTWQFVSLLSPEHHGTAVIFCMKTERIKQVASASLSKPETQKQREEREQLEAAYDLYREWHKLLGHNSIRHISTFNEDDNYAIFRFFIARQKNAI